MPKNKIPWWIEAERKVDHDDPEEAAFTEDYDRQIQLADEQADDKAANEEAAVFQEHRSEWDDYWADQRYAAVFFGIHGQQPDIFYRQPE